MKISSILARVNDQLANAGYVTWSEEYLQRAYEEAVSVVLTALPVGHIETLALDLVAGTHQAYPATVNTVLGFLSNATAAGVATTGVADQGDMALFKSEEAYLSGMTFTPVTYAVMRPYIDPIDPRAFYVLPAVPDGYTGKLRARCATRPAAPAWAGDPDFPLAEGFDMPVKEYMLYIAFGRDDETAPTYSRGQTHKANFEQELQRLATLLGVPLVSLQMTEAARQ